MTVFGLWPQNLFCPAERPILILTQRTSFSLGGGGAHSWALAQNLFYPRRKAYSDTNGTDLIFPRRGGAHSWALAQNLLCPRRRAYFDINATGLKNTRRGGRPFLGFFAPFRAKRPPSAAFAGKRRLGKIRAERRNFLPEKIFFGKFFSPLPAPPKGDSLGPQRTGPRNCSIYFAEFGEILADFA